MSILGSCPLVIQASCRRAQVTALLSKGLPASALIGPDGIRLGVSVLPIGGWFCVVARGTANDKPDSFTLSPLRIVAMLLAHSQGARVEVASGRLPASEKTGLTAVSAPQSVRDCAVCARMSVPALEHGEAAWAAPDGRMKAMCRKDYFLCPTAELTGKKALYDVPETEARVSAMCDRAEGLLEAGTSQLKELRARVLGARAIGSCLREILQPLRLSCRKVSRQYTEATEPLLHTKAGGSTCSERVYYRWALDAP